jgi:cyclic pyranopterin monophosphate synthase
MNSLSNTDFKASEVFSKKGPVFATAIIAGTQAVKKTSDLIPFCHHINIEGCKIDIDLQPIDHKILSHISDAYSHVVNIFCTVKCQGKTGVEMEALVGVSNAALCVYDMLKGLSHEMQITDIQLVSKFGGKSDIRQA